MNFMLNTIYILWLRQVKRYGRSRARIVGMLGQPLLFLFALGFGFGPIYQRAGGGNYIEFLGPGIIAMGIVFTSMFAGIELIWDRQFGFLKETLVAPVSRFSIMLGRTLGGATTGLIQGLVVFFLALFAGFRPVSYPMMLVALLFMTLIAVFFTAFGTAIASKMQDMQAFPIIMNFLVMPMFFLSGAIFPLKGLSPIVLFLARLNPLSYGVDGLHAALTGQSVFSVWTDLSVTVVLTLALVWAGSWLFSKIEV